MEHLREVAGHAAGDIPVLLAPVARQFAPAALGVLHHEFHLLIHALSRGCQFVETVSKGHHLKGDVEAAAAADIARTMTAVVGEVERLLACRGRRVDGCDGVWIGVIVARGIGGIGLDQVDDRLSPQSLGDTKEQSGYEQFRNGHSHSGKVYGDNSFSHHASDSTGRSLSVWAGAPHGR